MSNNPTTSNNMRRPPMRPNPNLAKQRPQQNIPPRPPYGPRPNNINQLPPRPMPQRQEQKQEVNNAPTAQDMFASLSQAYNNMINNMQFMNAVGIVSGIYQNASQMQNQNRFANPFPLTPEQLKQQMDAYMATNQTPNNSQENFSEEQKMQSFQNMNAQYDFYKNINNTKEKQAFFDEFYAYLTSRMMNDNLFIRGQSQQVNQPTINEEVKKDEEKPQKQRVAEIEAQKQGLSLLDYLNKACNEDEFSQFDGFDVPKFDDTKEQEPQETSAWENNEGGSVVEVQEYSTQELKEALENVSKVNDSNFSESAEIEEKSDETQSEQSQVDEDYVGFDKLFLSENGEDSESVDEEIEKLVVDENDENAEYKDDSVESFEDVDSDLDVSIFNSDENQGAEKNAFVEDAVNANGGEMTEEASANDKLFDEDNEFFVDEEPEEIDFDDEGIEQNDFGQGAKESEDAGELTINLNNSQGENDNEEPADEDDDDNQEEDEEDFEDEDYSGIIVDEDGEFNRTMISKVLNAEDDIKAIYNDIKNYLLSYKGIKSRYSSACESFRLSRKLMAKFVIIGRTVKLYLALDPNAYPNNIYHQKDESKKKVYIDVPFMVKVKSNLSIRKAKELIDKLMQENGLVKNFKYKEKDYVEILKQSMQEG